MSNVLIGIIGVILFIGLALAGALFLGPRFQQSTLNSKAAATVQALKQVADAANLYRVQEGMRPTSTGSVSDAATATTLLGRKYLKSMPTGPFSGGLNLIYASTGDYVTVSLPDGSQTNDGLCEAIAKQVGSAKAVYDIDSGSMPSSSVRATCLVQGVADGSPAYQAVYFF